MSTYQGDYLLMDLDYRKHPAWTGKGFGAASDSNKNISTFNKKFGNLFKSPITSKA
jgi:large subunit ribosomal protein L31